MHHTTTLPDSTVSFELIWCHLIEVLAIKRPDPAPGYPQFVSLVMYLLHFGVLDFQVEMEVYARAGFLLLCITTFVPRTIEVLRVHTLTLPLENLKLKSVCKLMYFH